jgi:hypothetical protein
MTSKQIAGYLKAVREPLGISFNDGYNVPTYGITKAEYDAIDRAMHEAYGMAPERTPAGVRRALERFPTKKSPAQLDREIAEALARRPSSGSPATISPAQLHRELATAGVAPAPATIDEGRLDTFMVAYEAALRGQIAKHPEEYAYGPEAIPGVVAKMRAAFRDGAQRGKPGGAGWPAKGPSMSSAARAVGVSPTYKALGPYLRGE